MNQPLLAAARAAACVGLALSFCAGVLRAQTAPSTAPTSTATAPNAGTPAPATTTEPAKLEKFEVTGSLIKRTDAEGPSPVRFITREDIDLSGMDNLTDILRDIPEATNLGINEGSTIGAVRGACAIDLRFLGANNTLVLVDGRRQAPNGISSGGTVFVDLNRIPTSMVERVELLKDGASAVYGSDATAGVINIITRQNFVGAEVTARYATISRPTAPSAPCRSSPARAPARPASTSTTPSPPATPTPRPINPSPPTPIRPNAGAPKTR